MNIKPSRIILAALVAACFGASALPTEAAAPRSPRSGGLSRESGAIYIEDFADKRVELLAIEQVPIYATSQRRRAIGTLKKGKKVELIAMTDKQYEIRGEALHGGVRGWVLPSALASTDKDFVLNIRKMYERQKLVNEMIEQHQIALGMKIEEVIASMGRPTRKSSKLDKDGRKDTYEYITFDTIPQTRIGRDAYGNLVRQVYYIKVETGKMQVTFKDELVESIEQTEGDPVPGGKVRIVPFPVELW